MSWIWPDIADERRAIAATRPAFWASLVVVGLHFLTPVIGLATGAAYLVVALGIRARKVAATTAGLLCLTVSGTHALYLLATSSNSSGQFAGALNLVLSLAIAAPYLRSHRALQRFHEIRSSPRSQRRALSPVWLLAPLLIALIRFPILVSMYIIPTGSMEPTLEVGDHIIAERVSGWLARAPERGDVIIFRSPTDQTQIFPKRVVGLPGDRIQIIHKELWINRAQAREPYVIHKSDYLDSYRDNFPGEPSGQVDPAGVEMLERNVSEGELVVPPDSYFVLGDNRDHSLDSRYFGFVKQEHILGTPLFVYWSNDAETDSVRWNRVPTVIRSHDLTTK